MWNESVQDVMQFYNIRRYVTREGRRLGYAEDSAPDPEEYLMTVFHDIPLWDNRRCINETYTQRRLHLLGQVQPVIGRAEVGTQIVMDFTSSDSTARLACQRRMRRTKRRSRNFKQRRRSFKTNEKKMKKSFKLWLRSCSSPRTISIASRKSPRRKTKVTKPL